MLAGWRRLLELERAAQAAQFEAARQALGPRERVAAGLALGGLVLADATAGTLGRTAWVLARPGGEELDPTVSAGDPVLLTRRRGGTEPVRGLVSRRTRRAVTVVFDEPPDEAFEDGELLLDRMLDETTHQRMLAGLAELESAKSGRTAAWRRLLAGDGAPIAGKTQAFDDPRLNAPQREAVARALAAEELYLVHGPPGTGKTEVLAAIAAEAIARGSTVVACAASNAAVDNLVARLASRGVDAVRLGHPARVHPLLVEHTLEARAERHEKARIAAALTNEARQLLRRADRATKQGRAADRFAEARATRSEARRLFAEARTLARAAEDEVLAKAPAVCATLTGLASQRLRGRRFALAIVDEATQATVPATILALVRAEKVVLAGDQNQLPPTVLSLEAASAGLAKSLFERWQQLFPGLSRMLEVQHRMHREIMEFPSTQLYGGRLEAHPSVASHLLAELPGVARDERTAAAMVFVDSAGKGWSEECPEGGESRRNPGEAQRVVAEVRALRAAGLAARDIGVIAPYAAQVQLLRTLLPEEELDIDTVDAFQGREKEAICVSLTRSNDTGELGFCADVRRMNVALTRARRRLFVVGDSATVARHPFYAAFLEHTQATGAYRSAWEEPEAG